MRSQRDEPVAFDAPTALEDLLDRGLQVVKADLRERAAEPLKRLHMQLQERLLGLDKRRLTERRTGERGAHHEQMHLHRAVRELNERFTPVDLRPDAPGRGPAARTRRRPATPARAYAPARTAKRSPRRHRRRAHRRAADESAWPYDAACAAPHGRPAATSRSPPDTRRASAPASTPVPAWPAAPPSPALGAPRGDAHHAAEPTPGSTGPRDHDPFESARTAPSWIPLPGLRSALKIERQPSSHDRTEVRPVQAIEVGPVQTIVLNAALAPGRAG
ncbi:MAG: hypothetical protein QOI48_2440 [Solirubrobacteraceae bacterium]|nr:hypothetical protein [Solirubrobacteraceae bacterium]